MRLYRRLGHLKFKRLFRRYEIDLFKWLFTLKPGDIIGACTGFNHRVAEVIPIRRFIGRRGGWFIADVRVTDTEGRWHWAPGGGCVSRPYSREEILASARDYAMATTFEPEDRAFWQAILDAEKTEAPRLSPQGLYIGPPRITSRGGTPS